MRNAHTAYICLGQENEKKKTRRSLPTRTSVRRPDYRAADIFQYRERASDRSACAYMRVRSRVCRHVAQSEFYPPRALIVFTCIHPFSFDVISRRYFPPMTGLTREGESPSLSLGDSS